MLTPSSFPILGGIISQDLKYPTILVIKKKGHPSGCPFFIFFSFD